MDGKKLINKYEILKTLGMGKNGKIYLVRHIETQIKYAMKKQKHKIDTLQLTIPELSEELMFYSEVQHPFLIKCVDSFIDPKNINQYCLILEYAEGNDLQKYLMNSNIPPDEDTCMKWFTQILLGLAYLHCNSFIHCDLKLSNICLKKCYGQVVAKISDFGSMVQKVRKTKRVPLQLGTFIYYSPERFQYPENEKSDVWALGCLLYELLSGGAKTLFNFANCTTYEQIKQKIVQGENEINGLPSHISAEAKILIMYMTIKDPMKRISIREIITTSIVNHQLQQIVNDPEFQNVSHIFQNQYLEINIYKPTKLREFMEKKYNSAFQLLKIAQASYANEQFKLEQLNYDGDGNYIIDDEEAIEDAVNNEEYLRNPFGLNLPPIFKERKLTYIKNALEKFSPDVYAFWRDIADGWFNPEEHPMEAKVFSFSKVVFNDEMNDEHSRSVTYYQIDESGQGRGYGIQVIANCYREEIFEGWLIDDKAIKGRRIRKCWKTGVVKMYTGDYFNDKRHGQGDIVTSEGAMMKGTFKHGLVDGYAFQYSKEKQEAYEGEFANGMRHGVGILKMPNGKTIEARYVNGLREGSIKVTDEEHEDLKYIVTRQNDGYLVIKEMLIKKK
ncbi:hypothetical protein FGO68_gene2590 [Halteria grandinella]|uniref:Protein kinase domain-containing protein n=1 Tax=Halteria grandinella TaxID=5974 RepID=A0A8J8NVG2_HALGN|nr:hypothetical protein FGO68_gene2590 [Halteria grandinella]